MQASTKSSTIRYKLSSAFRVDRAHQLRDAPKRGEFLREIAPCGSDSQSRDTGSLVGPDAIAHHLDVTQQIRLDHHLGRHLGDRFGTLSGDPETLHFARGRFPSTPFECIVVEIRRRRTHRTERVPLGASSVTVFKVATLPFRGFALTAVDGQDRSKCE